MAEDALDLEEQLVLTDLLNRVLDRGVTVYGDVTISIAGVDLVWLGLRLDLSAIEPERGRAPIDRSSAPGAGLPAAKPHAP